MARGATSSTASQRCVALSVSGRIAAIVRCYGEKEHRDRLMGLMSRWTPRSLAARPLPPSVALGAFAVRAAFARLLLARTAPETPGIR
jgi:hypothetical protein